jgi:solute carrier family 25 phosphate transporter 3
MSHNLRSLFIIFFYFFFYHRFFADILLTPLEATRIRLVSNRNYATGLVSGFTRLAREGGIRELYAGFLPIICK